MSRSRVRFSAPVLGLCSAAVLLAGFGVGSALAAGHVAPKATASTIVVTAGKPTELAFKLSKTGLIPAGTVNFKVTNAGRIAHTFAICLTTSTNASANACKGKSKVTRLLQSGQSQTLTTTLTKKGMYEYLCTFPGHASAGMKGLLGIGVKVKPTPTTTTTTTTSSTTATTTTAGTTTSATTTTAATTSTIVNDGCPTGTTIVSSGNTDGDDDETGRPSDDDGCI